MPYKKDSSMIDLSPMTVKSFHALFDLLKRDGVSNGINRCWLPPIGRLRRILAIYGDIGPDPIQFNVRLDGRLMHIEIVGWTPERFAKPAAPKEKP